MFAVCNRTYYGDVGRTYTIQVPTPQWNRIPFLCHLTFTASGHEQGDIVQVSVKNISTLTCADWKFCSVCSGQSFLCSFSAAPKLQRVDENYFIYSKLFAYALMFAHFLQNFFPLFDRLLRLSRICYQLFSMLFALFPFLRENSLK